VSGRRAGQRFDAEHGVTTEALVFLGELDPDAIGPSLEFATHYEPTPVAQAEALLDASPLAPGRATFVDLGAGTPLHKSSTRVLEDIHLTAQAANPSVRVAYIDNDRIFAARSKAFRATARGVAVAEADLTDPTSVLAHPGVRREIDPTAIDDYLTYGYIPAPKTVFRGVFKLPPAHTLTLDLPADDRAAAVPKVPDRQPSGDFPSLHATYPAVQVMCDLFPGLKDPAHSVRLHLLRCHAGLCHLNSPYR